ncbi:putative GTP cyclohydrolase II [Paratrimastix pyriformis]|uniref:GTP cyclohydrolase II n=1 Tax=Paratrimastix pyriformis TaxID=342808 RepID=A0ABQ8U9A7_9EUKA|nr:putative GTP cyclohydrolase II [Paratrimastix pyriformis]
MDDPWVRPVAISTVLLDAEDRCQPFFELSNSYGLAPFTDNVGHRWRTAEHYFQAQQFQQSHLQEAIRHLSEPDEAVQFARVHRHDARPEWPQLRLRAMETALAFKFSAQNPAMVRKLVGTGDALLVHCSHEDLFWGDGGDRGTKQRGRNMLGYLLMCRRSALQTEHMVCKPVPASTRLRLWRDARTAMSTAPRLTMSPGRNPVAIIPNPDPADSAPVVITPDTVSIPGTGGLAPRQQLQYCGLLNSHPAPICDEDGTTWPTVEHAFHAAKFPRSAELRRLIRLEPHPGRVFDISQLYAREMDPSFPERAFGVMERALRLKYAQHPRLAACLVSTAPRPILFRTETPSVWSQANRLGELLMRIRDELLATRDRRPRPGAPA